MMWGLHCITDGKSCKLDLDFGASDARRKVITGNYLYCAVLSSGSCYRGPVSGRNPINELAWKGDVDGSFV